MVRTVKRLLPNTETEIFYNWDDTGTEVVAMNISVCNTSSSPVKVHLGFVEISGLFLAGAVMSNTEVPANQSITISIPPRIIAVDESIRAWAEVPNVIALSIDLTGVYYEDDVPLP